jgi:TonB family protein
VDVRVKIDAEGRVTSASPLTRGHNGLEAFLIARAVEAAKQWRYEPAPPASEIIHFNFEK